MTTVHAVHDTERHTAELQGRALRDRIHACVPVTGQAFAKLLSLLSIEVSDKIPTACVTTGARSSMLVNPGFVARHCRTDEHLSMLVLHELYHVLLGHTRLYPRATPAQNWAFDCLINAQLCRLFPSARYTTFFAQFTHEASGPVVLLAPPPDWDPDPQRPRETRAQPLACYGEGSAALLLEETHWRLYSDESVTTEELYRLLERAAGGDELEEMPLLGNHDPTAADADATLLHPDLLREFAMAVRRRRDGLNFAGPTPEAQREPQSCVSGELGSTRENPVGHAERLGQGALSSRDSALPQPDPDGLSTDDLRPSRPTNFPFRKRGAPSK